MNYPRLGLRQTERAGEVVFAASAGLGYFGHHFFIDFPRHRLTSKWTIVTFNIGSCGRTMNASKRVGKRINRLVHRLTKTALSTVKT